MKNTQEQRICACTTSDQPLVPLAIYETKATKPKQIGSASTEVIGELSPLARLCAKGVLVAGCVLLVATPTAVAAKSVTCAHFNAMGVKTNNVGELLNSKPTGAQIEEYKKVIASHAAELSFFILSARTKALNQTRKADRLTWMMVESLAFTREDCFNRPGDSFETVATRNFDYLLDAVAKRMGY